MAANSWSNLVSSQIGNSISNSVSPLITKSQEIISKQVNEFADQFVDNIPKFSSLGNNINLGNINTGQTLQSMGSALKSYGLGTATSIGAWDISEISGITGNKKQDEINGLAKYGVRLVSSITGFMVFFDVMPTISESRSATYDEVSFPQHPGALLKYAGTSVRSWSIGNIVLISRNSKEASKNQMVINQLRGWLMPYYGYGTDANEKTRDLLGAPPDILSLSAYGDYNIKDIPVVLTDLSIEWPNDVDYITTEEGEPFPVIMHIGSLNLREARSAREYSGFDITSYRMGDMVGAYKPVEINADQAGARTSAQEVDKGADTDKATTEEIKKAEETNPYKEAMMKKSEPKTETFIEKVKPADFANFSENTYITNGYAKDTANSIIQNSYFGITQKPFNDKIGNVGFVIKKGN